jgi:hypothetical protein
MLTNVKLLILNNTNLNILKKRLSSIYIYNKLLFKFMNGKLYKKNFINEEQ